MEKVNKFKCLEANVTSNKSSHGRNKCCIVQRTLIFSLETHSLAIRTKNVEIENIHIGHSTGKTYG